MFNTLVTVAIVIAALLAAVLGYAATRPDTFAVRRTAVIAAPAASIYPLVTDFHQWGRWSPWERKDPAMSRSFSGAANGKGAVYAWDGNGNVGAGRMEIADVSPPSKVTINLDFIRPFEGHNVAEFTFEPRGDSTVVTWAMHGPMHYVAKVIHLFVNMDTMIGREFETGLANLKSVSEK